MTAFVLLHGTTQSPAGWDRLVDVLQRRGHASYAVDLALGNPDASPSDYAGAAAAQVPEDLHAPVVVAHSGAGLLLPDVARALNARRQVWLTAWIPDGTQTFLQEVTAHPRRIFNEEWLGKDPASDPVLATYFLFHDCDLATLQWGLTTLRVFFPKVAYEQPIPLALDIPSDCILTTGDRTLRPDWLRTAAWERLGAQPAELPGGHCPHVSRPADLADMLTTIGNRR